MEMRRRSPNGEDDVNGTNVGGKAGRPRRTAKHIRKGDQPVISTTCVVCLVVTFIFAGCLQYHYDVSRGKDPLSGAGLPLPKYMRDMQHRQGQKKKQHDIENKNIDMDAQQQSPKSFVESSLLTKEEDLRLERDQDGIRYHLIFSTDCSPYQHWQSFLVYFSAMMVRQPGHVTRIASGCEGEEAKNMEDWFQNHISHMSTRFHVQLTPKFSSVKNEAGESLGDYKYFNKPFGLKYWMEHAPQLQFTEGENTFPEEVHGDIVILIDPDMGLLRPITRDFSNDGDTVITPRRRQNIITRVVGPGKPAAQVYGFGTQWAKLNLTTITGTADTPAAKVSRSDGQLYYPVGPPYLATVPDMYRIAEKWTEFAPKVHDQYPYLLAEMFGFCIAAAHLELPHQLISSLMISDIESDNAEGWPLIDSIPSEHVCDRAKSLVQYPADTSGVPNVVHMCQRYGLGSDWFFSKRAVPAESLYDCEAPLYQEPPNNLVEFDYKIQPPKFERKDVTPKDAKRLAFILCYLYRLINEAAAFYKANACTDPNSPQANLEKTRSLIGYMKEKKQTNQKS